MPRVVVLLDAGGVLFDNVTEHSPFFAALAGRFGVGERALRERYEAQDAEFETGAHTGAAAVATALASLGVPRSAISPGELRATYGRYVRPNRPLLEFLRRRRHDDSAARRYHLTLANNEARDWDAEKDRRFGHLGLCDSLSCSWLIGAAKPQPRFFTAALARLHADPAEAVLVDDNAACLDAARALGLAAHAFRGAEDLVAMLGRL
jgi:putative hydrolase of the HAD superfamily